MRFLGLLASPILLPELSSCHTYSLAHGETRLLGNGEERRVSSTCTFCASAGFATLKLPPHTY